MSKGFFEDLQQSLKEAVLIRDKEITPCKVTKINISADKAKRNKADMNQTLRPGRQSKQSR